MVEQDAATHPVLAGMPAARVDTQVARLVDTQALEAAERLAAPAVAGVAAGSAAARGVVAADMVVADTAKHGK
jgi:hypothetical protein